MNYSNYSFTLDIQSIQSQVSIPVKLGDTARKLYINITDGGVPYIIEDGCRAVFSAIKPDNNPILNDCAIKNNSVIQYDFTEYTASCPGVTKCELILYGAKGDVIASPRFVMVVDDRVIYNNDIINIYSNADLGTIDSIITVEQERVTAEQDRVAAEQERVIAEQDRVAAEQARVNERNELARDLEVTKRKVANLETAATGNIYETVVDSSCASTIQLPEPLPYGILSRVDSGVRKIEIGLPYTLVGAKTYSGTPCVVKDDSIIMPKGETYYVMFPCVLHSGATVTVMADGKNDAGDEIAKFQFRTTTDSLITEGWVNGSSVKLNAESAYLCITKKSQETALTADLEIRNIRVIVTDPDEATIYPKHTIEIPEALISYLDINYSRWNYWTSDRYSFFDLTTRTVHILFQNGEELPSPVVVDVSEYLDKDIDIIPLEPRCLVRFHNCDSEIMPSYYTISYKNKIGG